MTTEPDMTPRTIELSQHDLEIIDIAVWQLLGTARETASNTSGKHDAGEIDCLDSLHARIHAVAAADDPPEVADAS